MRSLLPVLLAAAVSAAPVAETAAEAACTAPRLRKGWHNFSADEKKAYIDAELCLQKLPATMGFRGAKTKFDELQSVHIFQSEIAHGVGQFFPFHRLFMYAHEYQLQNVCGYKGAQPYWDESRDAGNFSHSAILDPVTGFGGTGSGASQCITDGPFAGYMNPLGPGYIIGDHCITRQVNDFSSWAALQYSVDYCLSATTYILFWKCVEGGPHGAGHGGINGEMMNPVSSPGDPLFYMHHTWLDRIWAQWQDKNASVRMTEIGGNNVAANPFGAPGGAMPGGNNGSAPFPWPGAGNGTSMGNMMGLNRPADVPAPQIIGDPGKELTLNHLIQMYEIVPNMTVADVMNTRGRLCYEYD